MAKGQASTFLVREGMKGCMRTAGGGGVLYLSGDRGHVGVYEGSQ